MPTPGELTQCLLSKPTDLWNSHCVEEEKLEFPQPQCPASSASSPWGLRAWHSSCPAASHFSFIPHLP